jgi:hypothetical protein
LRDDASRNYNDKRLAAERYGSILIQQLLFLSVWQKKAFLKEVNTMRNQTNSLTFPIGFRLPLIDEMKAIV